MKPESSLESDQKAFADSGNAQTAAPGGGVTGMFETLAAPASLNDRELTDLNTPKPAEAALPRPSSPVVHEVVVGTSDSGESLDPLASLLRSSPPVRPTAETPPRIPPPAAPAANGGFTQLLRALNQDQFQAKPTVPVRPAPPVTSFPASPAAAPVAQPEPASAVGQPGSFTQLFRALDTPSKPSAPGSQVVVGGAFTQQANPQAAPQSTVESKPADAGPAPASGSFTQLFQALDSPAAPVAKPVALPQQVVAGEAFGQQPVPSGLPVAPVPEVAAAPSSGSFTQLFQAQTVPAAEAGELVTAKTAEPARVPESTPAPAAPGAFTQMLNAADLSKLRSAALVPATPPPPAPRVAAQPDAVRPPAVSGQVPPAPPATGAGTFTQLFRTLESPPQAPSPQQASGGFSGSATETFAALSPAPEPQPSPSSSAPVPTPSVAPHGPGSFTQLFRNLDTPSATPPASVPSNSGGSAYDPFAPSAPPMPAAAPASEPGASLGASQMFSTYGAPAQPSPPPSASPQRTDFGYAAPDAAPAPVANQGGAGLTQLLRTLEQPGASATSQAAYSAEPLAPAGAQPGIFTAAYQTLNTPGTPSVAPSVPAQPTLVPGQTPVELSSAPQAPIAAAPAIAGQSEFTRILNASALREAGLRAGAPAGAMSGTAAPAASGGGFPGIPKPPAMPTVPGLPAAPAVPHAPAMPAVPQFKMPEAQAPAAKAPEAPAAASPQTRLQQYLPLLLILIIFVLVAILIAVILLLKH